MLFAKKDKKEDKLLKLTKGNIVVTGIIFIILLALAIAMMALCAEIIFSVEIDKSMDSEINYVLFISDVFADNTQESDYNILDECGRDYILFDKDGSIISRKGLDTRGNIKGRYAYDVATAFISEQVESESGTELVADDEILLTNDINNNVITPYDEARTTHINHRSYIKKTIGSLSAHIDELEKTNSTDDEKNVWRKNVIEMPIWATVELSDGRSIAFKCTIAHKLTDIMYIFLVFVLLCGILLILFLFLFINAVKNALKRRRITKILFTDITTGGYNMTWFMVKGRQLLRKRRYAARKLAVVRLEFVKYRRFCVCHSISEGEKVLKIIYARMKLCLNKKEMLAHSADGCFALILFFDNGQELSERLEQIIKSVENVYEGHKFVYHAGAGLINEDKKGIFQCPRKNVDLEEVFDNACTACTSLEERDGSAAVIYNDKLVEEQRWADAVEVRQRAALEREEFEVYYQPKYAPSTGELRGAEALIRWQSPEYGFVTPYKFIPVFEKNGFITEIDHYMITHVARDQKRWLDMGFKCVPVSVNVSRAHFIESDLAEQIRDLVDAEGTPHELVEIELTESAFFDDKKAMINTITKLKSYGFAVSMDDFGSGYSSLNSLKDMPLDVLKLDAEFFRGEAAGTDRGEIVVSEAIKLAKSLNMRTVAEGVEIKEQVDFLASQGCDMIQGYYFAKPMPKGEYEERMKNPIKDPEAEKVNSEQ